MVLLIIWVIIVNVAPEMLIHQPYGYSIDWWAIGTILYELCYRHLPFGGEDKESTTQNIKNMVLMFPNEKQPPKYPRTEKELEIRTSFIKGLLDRDVELRLGSSNSGLGFETDIKTHPFFINMDWDALLKRQIKPTFKPIVLILIEYQGSRQLFPQFNDW